MFAQKKNDDSCNGKIDIFRDFFRDIISNKFILFLNSNIDDFQIILLFFQSIEF